MFSKKVIRIIAIVLAALMGLSALAVLLQVFGADGAVSFVPVTGDNDGDYILPAVFIVIAVIAVVLCVVLPKIKKKNND